MVQPTLPSTAPDHSAGFSFALQIIQYGKVVRPIMGISFAPDQSGGCGCNARLCCVPLEEPAVCNCK